MGILPGFVSLLGRDELSVLTGRRWKEFSEGNLLQVCLINANIIQTANFLSSLRPSQPLELASLRSSGD